MCDPLTDLLAMLSSAKSDGCRMALARRVVAAKADRGDYDAILHGPLTADTKELLALAIVRGLTERTAFNPD